MTIRGLLVVLLGVSLAFFTAVTYTAEFAFLQEHSKYHPAVLPIGASHSIKVSDLIIAYFVFMVVVMTVIFFIQYVVLDRNILKPIKTITGEMIRFTKSQQIQPLPDITLSTVETRELVQVFGEFTKTVQSVHERDVEVSRLKSDFISTAAHQLRTPMTGIRWSLEALQKSGLTPDQQVLVDSATNKSKDLVAIIGTLLDISAIESGKYHYNFASVRMEEMLQSLAQEFSELAKARNISLFVVGSGEPVPPARADSERIKWVLNNLIENAIRYTPADGSVHLSVSAGLGKIFIKVKDTGIGIKAEDRANIFERFYRAGNAIEKENAGNGLGLYIARTIAKDHGGDINFEPNQDGPGTTFTLTLLPYGGVPTAA